MADLAALKHKYQPVLDVLAKEDATIDAVELAGEQLHLKATVVSEASKNRVWDAIKAVDPNFADLVAMVTELDTTRRKAGPCKLNCEKRLKVARLNSRIMAVVLRTGSNFDDQAHHPGAPQCTLGKQDSRRLGLDSTVPGVVFSHGLSNYSA